MPQVSKETIIYNYLKVILDDVEPDIVSYICGMKQEEDLEEFFENIINLSNPAHEASYNGIKQTLFGKKPQKTTPPKPIKQETTSSEKKSKKKFTNINSYQEKKKEKIGRTPCDCMGQEHDFMNNCLFCGRIHCVDEGPGPCLFCGNEITVRGATTFHKPQKHKENKIFDDDNDYFKIKSKRSEKEEDKRKMVIALDFATRRIIEGTQGDAKIREQLLEESMQHLKKVERVFDNIQKKAQASSKKQLKHSSTNNELVELMIKMRHRKPAGIEDLGIEDSSMPIIDYPSVFDEEFMTNMDHGLCLSMHQPYASLLVAGVKQHEGRTWPTTHHGKLWIAAAAKEPEQEEIIALQNFYKQYYNDPSLRFPRDYPTGCLLGCVYVEDCLDQESYREKYPNGESESPFVLICSNPIILPIFYPIVGKHKIYALDKELHKCAKIALQHAKYIM